MNQATILQRKRQRIIKMADEEILLILRAYQAHPTRWSEILDEIRQNMGHLPQNARELYQSGSSKKLRDRMSSKFGKLMSGDILNIKNEEIRTEVRRIKEMERRLVVASVESNPTQDKREEVVNEMSEDEDLTNDQDLNEPTVQPAPATPGPAVDPGPAQPGPSEQGPEAGFQGEGNPRPGRPKRRRLGELIRENQELYNKFIKNKIPKLFKELGVSSDSE